MANKIKSIGNYKLSAAVEKRLGDSTLKTEKMKRIEIETSYDTYSNVKTGNSRREFEDIAVSFRDRKREETSIIAERKRDQNFKNSSSSYEDYPKVENNRPHYNQTPQSINKNEVYPNLYFQKNKSMDYYYYYENRKDSFVSKTKTKDSNFQMLDTSKGFDLSPKNIAKKSVVQTAKSSLRGVDLIKETVNYRNTKPQNLPMEMVSKMETIAKGGALIYGVSKKTIKTIKPTNPDITKLRTKTKTDGYENLKNQLKLNPEDSKFTAFKKTYYSRTLKNMKTYPNSEYLKTNVKIKLDKNNSAILNKKTGRIEILENGGNLKQKIKNLKIKTSVKMGLEATPIVVGGAMTPELKKTIKTVKIENAKKIGLKTGGVVLKGAKNVSKAGQKIQGVASGEVTGNQLGEAALKTATKPIKKKTQRVINSKIKNSAVSIVNKIKNGEFKKSINRVRKRITNTIKKQIKSLATNILKTFTSILAKLGPALLPFVFIIIVIFLISAKGTECSNSFQLCDSQGTYFYEYNFDKYGDTAYVFYKVPGVAATRQYLLQNGQIYGKVLTDSSKNGVNYVYADRYDVNGQLKTSSEKDSTRKYYLISLPSYYVYDGGTTTADIGSKFLITTETGSFYAVFADLHADGDTGAGDNPITENCVTPNTHYMVGMMGSRTSAGTYENNFGKIVSIQRLSDGTGASNTGQIGGCGGTGTVNASWKPNYSIDKAWRKVPGTLNPSAGNAVTYDGRTSRNVPGDGQCVYYADGFIAEVYGLRGMGVNGDVYASTLVRTYPDKFVLVNGQTGTPVGGAIYSCTGPHVGIILDYNPQTGNVVVADGNWNNTGKLQIWTTSLSWLRANRPNLVFANPK